MPFAGSNSYGIANFFDRSVLFLDQLRIDPVERGIAMTAQSGMISCNVMYADNVTTGMIVNYFDIKDDIIAAALRLAFVNIGRKIAERTSREDLSDLAEILEPAIPAGQSDQQDIAVWIEFWGRPSADPEMRKLNDGLHQEGLATYAAAIRAAWPESAEWPDTVLSEVLISVATCLFGLSSGGITTPSTWPPSALQRQLRLQLQLLREWAVAKALELGVHRRADAAI